MSDSQLRRVEYLQRLNFDILDTLRNQIDWLFDFCDKHNIKIPISDLQTLISLSKTAGNLLDKYSPTESDDRIQPFKKTSSDEEDTEPSVAMLKYLND